MVSDIQNQCDTNSVSECGDPKCPIIHHHTQSLGVRESKAKIDKLEKEIFVLKLQLTHYRNDRPIQIDEKRLISLQVSFRQCHNVDVYTINKFNVQSDQK